jgi:hypothetical protein
MAATYRTSTVGGGTSGTTARTAAITTAVGDLLICFVAYSGVTTLTSVTDNAGDGGTWTQVQTALFGSSANIGAVYVRSKLMASAVSVTVTVNASTNTAGEIVLVAYSGMRYTGSAAVRSKGSQANQASGTPAPALNQAALTANPVLTFYAAVGTVGLTAPTSWTSRQSAGQTTPSTWAQVCTRDSGFTGTTVTWGSSSSVAFASIAIELDSSVPPLVAAQGSFTLTGNAATLSYTDYGASLPWSNYFRGSFGGQPWVETASAGVSGTKSNLVTDGARAAPSTGTAQNGYTPARYTAASNQSLANAGDRGYDIFDTVDGSAGTIVALIRAHSLATANADIRKDAAIYADTGGSWLLAINASEVHGLYNKDAGGTGWGAVSSGSPLDTTNYHVVVMRWGAGVIGLSIDGGTEVTQSLSITGLDISWPIISGRDASTTTSLDASLLELGAMRVRMSDTQIANYITYVNARYALSISASAKKLVAAAGTFALAGQAALLKAQRLLTAAQASVALAGQAMTPRVGMPAAQASFALAGQAMTPRVAMPAAQAGFALSGIDSVLRVAMPAAIGSFANTGNAAGLTAQRKLAAAQASFVETGFAATLTYTPITGSTMTAAQAAFVLTRNAALLTAQRKIAAAFATFAETGNAVNFLRGLRMPAVQAAFGLAGQSAILRVAMLAVQGAYALSGTVTGLTAQRRVTAVQGAFALAGIAMIPRVTMPAAQASFALAGQAMIPRVAMPAAFGSFSLAAQVAGLTTQRKVVAAQVAYTLTRFAAGLIYTPAGQRTIVVDAGLFVLTRQPASLVAQRKVVAANGGYVLSGTATGLRAARRLTAAQASYVLAAVAASLLAGHRVTAAQASFVLLAQAVGLRRALRLLPNAGLFTLTGFAVALSSHSTLITIGRLVTTIRASTGFLAHHDAATSFVTDVEPNTTVFRSSIDAAATFDSSIEPATKFLTRIE